jgi:hypothetical protein
MCIQPDWVKQTGYAGPKEKYWNLKYSKAGAYLLSTIITCSTGKVNESLPTTPYKTLSEADS